MTTGTLRGVVVGVALVVAGIGLWWALGSGDAPAPTVPAPMVPAPTVSAPPEPPVARERTTIPRPARAAQASPPTTAEPRLPPAEPDTDGHTDTDDDGFPRVEGAPRNLRRDLQDAMKDAGPELVACLSGWHDAQPEVFRGKATFSFTLDADGMSEIELLDATDVPSATLDCLGETLWDDLDWPAVEQRTEVTWPIQVSVRDDAE